MVKRALVKDTAPAISDEVAFTELFRTPVVCMPPEDISVLAPYIGSEFPIVAVDSVLLDELKSRPGERIFLSSPPCIVALLTTDPARISLLADVKTEFDNLNAPFVPTPKLIDLGDLASIVGALAAGVGTMLTEQARMISLQARETSQLRQKNEQLQNQFHSLEAYLDRRGEQPCDVVFTSSPAAEGSGELPMRMVQGERLGQLLPVASQGICGFALCVVAAGDRDCQLHVSLKTLEDGKTLGNWTIQADQLRKGWNNFALQKSIAGLKRSARLEFSVTGSGNPPLLALGEIQPVLRFQLWNLETVQPISHRNLALKIFAGLPGLMVPDWFSTAGKDIQGFQEIVLPSDLLATVRQTQFNDPVSYAEVVFLADEEGILCHPPAKGITIAEIPAVLAKGTVRVSAVGFLPSNRSQSIELLLKATLPGGETTSPRIVESGWTVIEPDGSAVLNLFFKEPISTNASLELASRMTKEGNNNFAWAKFKEIVFVLQR